MSTDIIEGYDNSEMKSPLCMSIPIYNLVVVQLYHEYVIRLKILRYYLAQMHFAIHNKYLSIFFHVFFVSTVCCVYLFVREATKKN